METLRPGSKISLVIPVYNRPVLIAECLRSLAPCLGLLHEVVVVDDGSTDGRTPQAVQETIAALQGAGTGAEADTGTGADRIRLIQQDNAGPGAARNAGVAAARGDWIAFLDSDDLWLPWSGAALADCIAGVPEAAMIFQNARPFADPPEEEGWTQDTPVAVRHDGFFDMAGARPRVIRIGSGYVAIRRDVFSDSGGFVPGLRGSEDTDLFYRIAEAGPCIALEHPVLVARRTGGEDSLTLNMSALSEGLYFLLEGRRSGRYGQPRPALDRSLAELLSFWIHALFWGGWGREAYDLLLRQGGFGILWRNGKRQAALKLVGVPALSVVRPRNHRFSWRPRART